jgi:hypothetical protein
VDSTAWRGPGSAGPRVGTPLTRSRPDKTNHQARGRRRRRTQSVAGHHTRPTPVDAGRRQLIENWHTRDRRNVDSRVFGGRNAAIPSADSVVFEPAAEIPATRVTIDGVSFLGVFAHFIEYRRGRIRSGCPRRRLGVGCESDFGRNTYMSLPSSALRQPRLPESLSPPWHSP